MSAIGKQVAVQVAGKRLVILEQSEYERLCRLASETVRNDGDPPALPRPDKNGRVPAIEFTRISIARDIIRDRKELGLSQESLAALAGVRTETIARIESGQHTPSIRTIDKIDRALKQAKEKQQSAQQRKPGKKGK